MKKIIVYPALFSYRRDIFKILHDEYDYDLIFGINAPQKGQKIISDHSYLSYNNYVFKISKSLYELEFLDFQNELLFYLNGNKSPKVINDINGSSKVIVRYKNEEKLCLRLLTWISGRVWSSVNPKTDSLRSSLGEECGLLTKSLQKFDHPYAHREFEWDIAKSIWVEKHLNLFKKEEKKIIEKFLNEFKKNYNNYKKLRKGVIHNDANDNNIIVNEDILDPRVLSLIDFGDAIYTQKDAFNIIF